MTAVKELKATARERVGKGAARHERRQGRIPAVIYGAGQPAQPITLDYAQTRTLIFAGRFLTTIFEIEVGNGRERVIPRDYQLDPVKDFPVHVDFLRVGADATISVDVPVHFINQDQCPGLKRGGTLNMVRHTVELLVRVDAIPNELVADLAGLDINDAIHISAIPMPEGARPTITDRDFTVATIAAPSVLEEPQPQEGEEAAAVPAEEGGEEKAEKPEKSDKKD